MKKINNNYSHKCVLPPKPSYSLPKLAPNSSCFTKFLRFLRTLSVLNPKHPLCKSFFRNTSTMLAEQKRHATGPYSLIIHPFSRLSMIIDFLFFLAWTYSILITPMDEEPGWLTSFENYYIYPCQYTLIICSFFLGYVEPKSQEIILNHKTIALHYLKTYFFVDFLAVTLETTLNFKDHLTYLRNTNYYIIHKITSTSLYYMRKKFILTKFERVLRLLGAKKLVLIFFVHLLNSFIYVHFFCCVCVYGISLKINGRAVDPPPESWLGQAGIKRNCTILDPDVYSEAMMLTLAYFVGATRASFTIILIHEQIGLTIVCIFGRLYTLFLIANVLQEFGITAISESQYENHLNQLKEYMISKNTPPELRKRLLAYYKYKLQRRYFNETEIMNKLTEHLQTEIFLYKAKVIVKRVSALKQLPTDTLVKLIASMKAITYSPKDVICKIDSEPEGAYFISHGTVMVTNRENFELAHLEDGSEFGVLALLADIHLYTYAAIEATELFFLTKQQFFLLLASYPDVIKAFEKSGLEKVVLYKRVEETMKKGGTDVLSRLRRRTLLETLTRRIRF